MNAAHFLTYLRGILLSLCACAVAAASDSATGDSVRDGVHCISAPHFTLLAGIDQHTTGSAQRDAKAAAEREAPETRRQRLRPMTRRELRTTLGALEPIRQRDGTWTIRAATSRTEVDFERMQVVYTDAVGLLTFVQADEALVRLSELPGSDPQLEAQVTASFDRLGDCLQGRFEPWGGDETVAEMLDMIDDVRPRLESLIIKQLERRREDDPR